MFFNVLAGHHFRIMFQNLDPPKISTGQNQHWKLNLILLPDLSTFAQCTIHQVTENIIIKQVAFPPESIIKHGTA